jgi:hypothetical protein
VDEGEQSNNPQHERKLRGTERASKAEQKMPSTMLHIPPICGGEGMSKNPGGLWHGIGRTVLPIYPPCSLLEVKGSKQQDKPKP